MRNTRLFALCGAMAMLGLAGCNRDAADTDIAATPATDTMPTESTAPVAAPAGTLTLATGMPGSYIADNTGRALYVMEDDDTGNKCSGDCLKAWPPLLATATPTAGSSSLQGAMVGTVLRSDGSTQVTYNGHPLYYYAKDTTASTTLGQDVTDTWGQWYLVGPSGVAMEDDGDDAGAGVTAEVPPAMDPVDPAQSPVETTPPVDTPPDEKTDY